MLTNQRLSLFAVTDAELAPVGNSTSSIVVLAVAIALVGAWRQIGMVVVNPFEEFRMTGRQALKRILPRPASTHQIRKRNDYLAGQILTRVSPRVRLCPAR